MEKGALSCRCLFASKAMLISMYSAAVNTHHSSSRESITKANVQNQFHSEKRLAEAAAVYGCSISSSASVSPRVLALERTLSMNPTKA